MKPVMIISTYPNKISIKKITNELIETKIIACVNITKISSIYSWNNKIEHNTEYLAIFKTTQKNKKILKEKIKKTHPYQVPEIAEITISSINPSYLKWLVESTN